MGTFRVVSPYEPQGDQPQAIEDLAKSIEAGNPMSVLLGVTGSGKTYTMAKVIERVQKPTLVLAHNKTLAAQLCSEFKELFPDSATPWTAAHQASLSITNSQNLLKLMSIESVMLSNHLILCRPLLLPPSIFPIIRVFSNESVLCIRWPIYWSLTFSISPSNEYSGLISFSIDWFDVLAVQGTLNSLLQHHRMKA